MQDREVPIYIDGAREGTLFIARRGTMTELRAELRDVGRLVRLRVFGDGEGYLGVPEPEAGAFCLTRRFTPMEAARLPKNIRYAAEKRLDAAPPEPEPEPPAGPRHVIWLGGRAHYF